MTLSSVQKPSLHANHDGVDKQSEEADYGEAYDDQLHGFHSEPRRVLRTRNHVVRAGFFFTVRFRAVNGLRILLCVENVFSKGTISKKKEQSKQWDHFNSKMF